MKRLDELENTGLIQRLKHARGELDKLKRASQRVGASNLVIIETTHPTDYIITVAIAAFETKKIRITYMFDTSTELFADIFIRYDWSESVSNNEIEVRHYDDPSDINSPDRKSWIIEATNHHGSTTINLKFKIFIHAADTGIISAAVI